MYTFLKGFFDFLFANYRRYRRWRGGNWYKMSEPDDFSANDIEYWSRTPGENVIDEEH